jgi:hypothetical protein
MHADENFRNERHRQPSQVGSIAPDFGFLEEDDIYIALVSEDLLRIKLVRHQDPVPPTAPVKGRPGILQLLLNFLRSSSALPRDEHGKKLVQVIPLYTGKRDWP